MYNKANYLNIKKELSLNWDERFPKTDDIGTMWSKFEDNLSSPMDTQIPNVGTKSRKYRYPLDKEGRSVINRKTRLWKGFKTSQSEEDYKLFYPSHNQVRHLTRKAQKLLEKDLACKCKRNSKKFWNLVKSKTKHHSGTQIYNEPIYGDDFKSSDEEKVNVLADFFSPVFIQGPFGPLPYQPPKNIEHDFSMEITPEIVMKKPVSLNTANCKSPGPDEFHD